MLEPKKLLIHASMSALAATWRYLVDTTLQDLLIH